MLFCLCYPESQNVLCWNGPLRPPRPNPCYRRDTSLQSRLLTAPSSPASNACREGHPQPLGILWQCLGRHLGGFCQAPLEAVSEKCTLGGEAHRSGLRSPNQGHLPSVCKRSNNYSTREGCEPYSDSGRNVRTDERTPHCSGPARLPPSPPPLTSRSRRCWTCTAATVAAEKSAVTTSTARELLDIAGHAHGRTAVSSARHNRLPAAGGKAGPGGGRRDPP